MSKKTLFIILIFSIFGGMITLSNIDFFSGINGWFLFGFFIAIASFATIVLYGDEENQTTSQHQSNI